MPYAPEMKQKSRGKILKEAIRLFKERGFEDVSIDEVMGEAGLTRGAFYAHFTSKADLIAHAFRAASGVPTPAMASAEELGRFADTYVSAMHRDNPGAGCPVAALTAEIAREGPQAREAYTEFLKYFTGVIDSYLGNDKDDLSDDALALVAQMVGAVQISRAVADPMLSTRVLKAGRQAVDYLLPPENETDAA